VVDLVEQMLVVEVEQVVTEHQVTGQVHYEEQHKV
tara:strand:- start:237 stop:341 length:105 start_codon:yes stop_codon:yes gene_type:complete